MLLRRSVPLWILLAILGGSDASAEQPVPAPLRSFVVANCLDCHSGDTAEANFRLDNFRFDPTDRDNLRTWGTIHRRVRDGEMPPDGLAEPNSPETRAFITNLEKVLIGAEQELYTAEGRSTVRRLNRVEHINALRDLLGMPHLDVGEQLPPDGLSDGFGKSSSSLPFSHVQIERYLEVADEAVRAGMAPSREKPSPKRSRVRVGDIQGKTWKQRYGNAKGLETLALIRQSPFLYQALKSGSGMPLVGREVDPTFENWAGNFAERKPGYVLDSKPFIDAVGILNHGDNALGRDFRATAAGRYKLRVGAYTYRANKGRAEPTDRTETIAFYSGPRLLGFVDVTPKADVRELDIWLNAGEEITVAAASLPLWRIETGTSSSRYPTVDVPAVAFQSFELEGPFIDQWPPQSHQRLFGDLPLKPIQKGSDTLDYEVVSSDPEADSQRLLTSFIEAAYRRPVREADLAIPMNAFRSRLHDGAPFQEAMISAYSAVLSSPHFVLTPMSPGPLSFDQLANRLSLFLWSTPADTSLRARIDTGSREELSALVDQMVADPRVERFTEHFVDHWLDLRNIGVTEPDENLYRGYSTWLLESMRMETRAYFLKMLRDDLPARTVFDSDFAIVNGALAELYGIDGVAGGQVRSVPLKRGSIRGGLLTQASVMKVSANGTTTSPVVRGAYVMDRLLGDPPPPPPEAVSAVEPDLSGVTTIREQLARHRADAICASCHAKIDPPGFALESFDVMGRFRERYHSLEKGDPVKGINRRAKPIQYKLGLPVDSSGKFEDGGTFEGVEDFRQLVLKDERAIARNLLERLVIYATGAPVSISDRKHTEAILDRTAAGGYGLRSMIHELIESPLFKNK